MEIVVEQRLILTHAFNYRLVGYVLVFPFQLDVCIYYYQPHARVIHYMGNWSCMLDKHILFKDNAYTNKHICNLNIGHIACGDFYWLLIYQNIMPPTCIQKWTEFFPRFNTADILIWHRIFKLSFSVTRETRFQTFQYLLIHRVMIPCNKWLCDKKIKM